MKIGILGGTFNPIHYGHLFISNYVMDTLNLDEIIFIPSGNPPHKKNGDVIDKLYRQEMVEMAIKDDDSFKIDYYEINKEGYSYAFDTLTYLKGQYPNDEFYYIIGQDAFLLMDTWHRYEEVLNLTEFIIVTRGEKVKDEIVDKYGRYCNKMTFLDTPVIEISSTEIRKRISDGKSISYYLPRQVEEYIKQKNLYI